MITERLRVTEAAFGRVGERFGESLVGHAARGLRLLREADEAVSTADERYREPIRSQQITRALARAESERNELAGVLQSAEGRFQQFENSRQSYFNALELDPTTAMLIVTTLQSLPPEKRAHLVRTSSDPKIVAAVSRLPAELGIVSPADLEAARARVWGEQNPASVAEVQQVEQFRMGLSLVLQLLDAGLSDLRSTAALQPTAAR